MGVFIPKILALRIIQKLWRFVEPLGELAPLPTEVVVTWPMWPRTDHKGASLSKSALYGHVVGLHGRF
jgi:hypothetical protein